MNKVAVDHQKEHRNAETQFTVPVEPAERPQRPVDLSGPAGTQILTLLPLQEHGELWVASWAPGGRPLLDGAATRCGCQGGHFMHCY